MHEKKGLVWIPSCDMLDLPPDPLRVAGTENDGPRCLCEFKDLVLPGQAIEKFARNDVWRQLVPGFAYGDNRTVRRTLLEQHAIDVANMIQPSADACAPTQSRLA